MPTLKVEVWATRMKGVWSLVPSRGSVRRRISQSTIRVNLDEERVAGALVVLERRRPLLWQRHGGGGRHSH